MPKLNLQNAKFNKCDEFYTLYDTIESQLEHFKSDLEDKIICCPCDDYKHSNFYIYFFNNFKQLNLKKLITSCYYPTTYSLFTQKPSPRANYSITELIDGQVVTRRFSHTSDGDFRNPEVGDLINQSDIIITNPPFSLSRDFLQVVRHKKFIFLSNMNLIAYEQVFPLFMTNKIFIGPDVRGGDVMFEIPEHYAASPSVRIIDGKRYVRFASIRWFNNIRHYDAPELTLTKSYSDEYIKFDTVDCININKTMDIPKDYKGTMAVPISFLDKFNKGQFEILGKLDRETRVRGNNPFTRILIRHR